MVSSSEVGPLLRSLTGAVVVFDREGRVLHWSDEAARLLGHSPGSPGERKCWQVFDGHDAFGNRYCSQHCPIVQLRDRGIPVRPFELLVRIADGTRARVMFSLTTLRTHDGHLLHLYQLQKPEGRNGEGEAPVEVRGEPAATTPSANLSERLSTRELEILGLIAEGTRTDTIAKKLSIAPVTVRNHTQRILRKLDVHSKLEAVAIFHRSPRRSLGTSPTLTKMDQQNRQNQAKNITN